MKLKKKFASGIIMILTVICIMQPCFAAVTDVYRTNGGDWFCVMGDSEVQKYTETGMKRTAEVKYIDDNVIQINMYTKVNKKVFTLKHRKTTIVDEEKQILKWEMLCDGEKVGYIQYEYLGDILEEVKMSFRWQKVNCNYKFQGYLGRFYKNKNFILYLICEPPIKWADIVAVILTNEIC